MPEGHIRILPAAAVLIFAAGVRAAPVPVVPGDSERARQVFERERCAQCHSVNGRGGRTAPDLGQRVDRGFTPAMFDSRLWNHAPTMWALIEATRMELPRLCPGDAADLFAFLYSSRFFDRPGDPERGKEPGRNAPTAQLPVDAPVHQFIHPGGDFARGREVFAEKRCAERHLRGAHGAPQLPG